ncbi:MAG: alkaline phosphatase PhoX [Longimicrobiales bacterium]
MSQIDRRAFFRHAATLGGAALFAPSLRGLAAWNAVGPDGVSELLVRKNAAARAGNYGELVQSTTCPEFWIPKDFQVVKLSETHLPSGANPEFTVPVAVDGMAAFRLPNGNVRLIRNHEVGDEANRATPFGKRPYDAKAGGGTTSLEVSITGQGQDLALRVVREFPSLTGTLINCAGGPTPWGSWLSCEETTAGPSKGYERPHGYVFEVPVAATEEVDPIPLRALGRFEHEAVAVDPRTSIVYLTEDMDIPTMAQPGLSAEERPGAGFYRFIPNRPQQLAAGGRLQMLAIRDRPRYVANRDQTPGTVLPVRWVNIEDPDPAHAEQDSSALFKEGWSKGAARFQRLEGCWWGDSSVFFNSTTGGNARAGQIWQYRPTQTDGGELRLVFESPARNVLDGPDNLCISPRGGLVVCEDGGAEQFIHGLIPSGELFHLVRAPVQDGKPRPTEFAGACFSPDGHVLFFNQQGVTRSYNLTHGATYALWGPWDKGLL